MATKRNKTTAEPVLKSWSEVEYALAEIKDINSAITVAEADHTTMISKLKEALAHATDAKLKRKARLEKDIQEYTEAHKDEVQSDNMLKTKVFVNGMVGMRWKPWSIQLVKKKDEVIAQIEKKKLTKWLRIKKEVDKEAVMKDFEDGKADNKKLASVSLKRDRKEEFWYSTDKAKAVSAEADAEKAIRKAS